MIIPQINYMGILKDIHTFQDIAYLNFIRPSGEEKNFLYFSSETKDIEHLIGKIVRFQQKESNFWVTQKIIRQKEEFELNVMDFVAKKYLSKYNFNN